MAFDDSIIEQITISNILETKAGFGLMGNGTSVYIPSGVMVGSRADLGMRMWAKMIENSRDRGDTPYMAVFMSAEDPREPAGKSGEVDQAQIVLDALEDGYLTTQEVAKELGVESQEANRLLNMMFAQGKVVKASVYGTASQRRATVLLWAKDVEAFVG
jgi:hypothetical protein